MKINLYLSAAMLKKEINNHRRIVRNAMYHIGKILLGDDHGLPLALSCSIILKEDCKN
jgi:hypothetical protein